MLTEEQHKILQKLFGPLELEILQIIWHKDWQTVQEVLDRLPVHKNYAYTTIMTVMSRLFKKGVLTRKKKGEAICLQSPRFAGRIDSASFFSHHSGHTG